MNQIEPQRSWGIIVAFVKFIAWEGLIPHPLSTSYLRMLIYFTERERRKFIWSFHLNPESNITPKYLARLTNGIIPALTRKFTNVDLMLDLSNTINCVLTKESSKPKDSSQSWIWLNPDWRLLVILWRSLYEQIIAISSVNCMILQSYGINFRISLINRKGEGWVLSPALGPYTRF